MKTNLSKVDKERQVFLMLSLRKKRFAFMLEKNYATK